MKEQIIDIIPYIVPEIENSILGAFIQDNEFYLLVADRINENWFYDDQNKIIFQVFRDAVSAGSGVGLTTITQLLKDKNKLDQIGVTYLMETVKRGDEGRYYFDTHIELLEKAHQRRQLRKIGVDLAAKAADLSNDVNSILTETQNDFLSLYETSKNDVHTLADGISDVLHRIDANKQAHGLTGIGTGLHRYDQFSGGLQKTDLVIIAGEKSQGKTSLAISIIKNAAIRYGAKIAFYSLEMSKAQLTARIIAQETGIPSKNILNHYLSKSDTETVMNVIDEIKNLPIYFDEKSTNSVDAICNSIRKLKLRDNIDIAVVDYLQLIHSDSRKSEEGQLAEITRKLKNIAKEQDITVIALSQLSRDKFNHEPNTNRLRGSGQIEEAADIILLVYRPEEYNEPFMPKPNQNIDSKGMAQITIGKGRNIGTGVFLLKFNAKVTGFYDYDPRYENQYEYNPNAYIESGND